MANSTAGEVLAALAAVARNPDDMQEWAVPLLRAGCPLTDELWAGAVGCCEGYTDNDYLAATGTPAAAWRCSGRPCSPHRRHPAATPSAP